MIKLLRSLLFITVTLLEGVLTAQEPAGIESAATCKGCHQEIYDQWSRSRHARSTPSTNILFAYVYELSQKDTDGQTKLYCIRCHAPVSQINGDVGLEQEITSEGITCDICHSITKLTDHPDKWPNEYDPGGVKRGTKKDSEPGRHKVVYSELFENSRICSGCHGDMLDIPGTRSCGNLTICDTDFEWKQSQLAAAGKSCVDCHMSGHDFSGAYSPAKLREAATIELNVKEFEGEVIATVEVINTGSAHLLPTGPPARMIFLKVSALGPAGQEVWTNFTDNPAKEDPFGVFHIVFSDLEGNVPSMPWLASRIVKDTRLRPEETRRLVYKFPSEGVENVTAKLFYRLAPPPLLDKFGISDETVRKAYLMAKAERTFGTE
ncbi:MAG: multiheme c-type cytochrome [Candidatus Neomarinimicrobiota bacterium]